jgi:hypothetical protein
VDRANLIRHSPGDKATIQDNNAMLEEEHSEGLMAQLNELCPGCGQPLEEQDFNSTHYIRLCVNWKCRLYKLPQGTRAKFPVLIPLPASTYKPKKRSEQPHYPHWLERRRMRYRQVRDLGIDSRRAAELRDLTGWTIEEIRELAQK